MRLLAIALPESDRRGITIEPSTENAIDVILSAAKEYGDHLNIIPEFLTKLEKTGVKNCQQK